MSDLRVLAIAVAVAAAVTVACALLMGRDDPHQCAPPPYDVDRVVKMHEELRQCAVEKEECEDNVKMCASLLRRCLE